MSIIEIVEAGKDSYLRAQGRTSRPDHPVGWSSLAGPDVKQTPVDLGFRGCGHMSSPDLGIDLRECVEGG